MDLSAFKPKDRPPADPVPVEQVKAIAGASNFPSREAKKEKAAAPADPRPAKVAPARSPAHRLRTGRTLQINARASAETVEEFYAIATAQNWKAAETLERAVAALKRELASKF
ncbi:stability/partitioning determinant [Methylorubrum aminovorans]